MFNTVESHLSHANVYMLITYRKRLRNVGPGVGLKQYACVGKSAYGSGKFNILGPVLGPDRPGFQSYLDFTASQPVGSVPGPFRPSFGHRIPANF